MPITFDVSQVQAALGLRYGNIRSIGAGGMACVFSAYDSVLARPVAVKLVSNQLAIEELAVRFQQEARLASRLHHPNIVTVLDFGRGENGILYLVMDLVEGGTLSQTLKESGPLPLEQAIKVLVQICDGLGHAHGQGVMHRDLKPSNVMLAENAPENSNVRIVDFGLAKVISGDQKLTRTGVVIGTPTYSSPEQFQSKPLDHRTDIYSFGCLMFETLTKRPPFKGQNQIELFDLHVNSPVPTLVESGYTGEHAAELDRIISTAMAKDRNDRYQTFQQLKSDLLALLPEESQLLFPDRSEEYAKNKFQAASFFSQQKRIFLILIAGGVVILALLLAKKFQQTAPQRSKMLDYASTLGGDESKNWTFFNHQKNGYETWTNIDCRMGDKYFKMLRGKNVQAVTLYAMRFTGSGLRYLRDEPLERLEMPESKIIDKNLHYIGDFKRLKYLDLSYSWITDAGVATIGELPDLNFLGMAGCTKLTDKSVDSIAKFAPNLTRLDLSYTPVGTAGYVKLKQLPHLTDLQVMLSDLNDETVKPILALDLHALSLSKNKDLTDKTIARLEKMPRLQDLRIEGCPKITEKALAALKKAHPNISIVRQSKKRDEKNFPML